MHTHRQWIIDAPLWKGREYIGTYLLHYRTLQTHIVPSKSAPAMSHPHQTKIYAVLTAPSKNTFVHWYQLLTALITHHSTCSFISFWFKGVSRHPFITCDTTFMKHLPFVISANLSADERPVFVSQCFERDSNIFLDKQYLCKTQLVSFELSQLILVRYILETTYNCLTLSHFVGYLLIYLQYIYKVCTCLR